MFEYWWPILLVILSNTTYQVVAKSLPTDVHPLASAIVTYMVGVVAAAVLYHVLERGGSLVREFQHINWTSFALGIIVVGFEVGMLYGYRVGWPVSTATVVQSGFVAVCLLAIGAFFYHEPVNATRLLGVALSIVGLYLLNN